jgi:hypothetical protein
VTFSGLRPTALFSLHDFDLGEPYAAWLRERVLHALVETAPVVKHYPIFLARMFVSGVADLEAAVAHVSKTVTWKSTPRRGSLPTVP